MSLRRNLPPFPEVLAQSCEKNSHKCEEKCLLNKLCAFSKNSIRAEAKSPWGALAAAPRSLSEEEPSQFCLSGYQQRRNICRAPQLPTLCAAAAPGLTVLLTAHLCVVFEGHVNFSDEVTAGLRISDGVVLFIDAAEGVSATFSWGLHPSLCSLCSCLSMKAWDGFSFLG